MRFRTSQETAARFLELQSRRRQKIYRRRGEPHHGTIRLLSPISLSRVTLDMNRATVREILDCVEERVKKCEAANAPIPHLTRLALAMLRASLAIA